MKIDLNGIDKDSFNISPHFLKGETLFLVTPKTIGTKWTRQNLIFRSSLWNAEGELVSASFKKFFNWSEQPDLDYTPFSLTANGGCNLIEKIDGSTLIVSKYKGNIIARTRGTTDATKIDNGYEIELLKQKYPYCFKFPYDKNGNEVETSDISYIFEWVSPANRIVIAYPEPDLYLLNIIKHEDYSYLPQKMVDVIANSMEVKRPQRFNFNSIKEMLASVEAFQGQEGLCVYCNHDQSIRKVKGAAYLALHRFKSNATLENTLDLFVEFEYPEYQSFQEKLIEKFDYECFAMVQGFASRICEAYKEAKLIIAGFQKCVEEARKLSSRKDQALLITGKYGETNRGGFVFKLLDRKPLGKDDIKKLLWQCLKNQ